jgi:hypothetical protein
VCFADAEGLGYREKLVQVKDFHGTVYVDTAFDEVHVKKLGNISPQFFGDSATHLFLKIFVLWAILDIGLGSQRLAIFS